MPPINQQGSRTGIVTALVIFVILFVTTLILWIYEGAERGKRDDQLAENAKKYGQVVSEADLNSPEIARLSDAAKGNPGQTAFGALLAERNRLARAAAGSEGAAPAQIDAEVAGAIAAARGTGPEAGVTPTDSLAGAVRKLAASVTRLKAERDDLTKQVAAARQETQTVTAGRDALLRQKDEQIATVTTQFQEATRGIEEYRAGTEERVTQISSGSTAQMASLNENVGALQAQINDRDANLKKLQAEIDILRRRLGGLRIDGKAPIMQQADGRIIRLPNRDVAMINLGTGSQIVQGMTFEVYDKFTGIPKPGDDATAEQEKLPVGKASLEVIRIGPGSSECRIIRRTPGQNLVEGDLIANLVYDPAVKYNFVVFGDFDMDNDGKASPSDAAVIQRLITQWGGKLMNEVNANTDFLVLGVQPTVEAAGDEQDPVVLKRVQEQREALAKYEATVDAAKELGIPVLNQNRFLYFVGYRSQAGR